MPEEEVDFSQITDVESLVTFLKNLALENKTIKNGVAGNMTIKSSGAELLESLDRALWQAKTLTEGRGQVTLPKIEPHEASTFFVQTGFRNQELRRIVTELITSSENVPELYAQFKVLKEAAETELAEREVGALDDQDFERVYPEEPYAGDLPQGARPIDKVVKNRWGRRR